MVAARSALEADEITLLVVLVDVIDLKTAALLKDVCGLSVEDELIRSAVDDPVLSLGLIQSHADGRAASAKSLHVNPDAAAPLVRRKIESRQGVVGTA
jgi:hypothetical protein